MIDMETSRMMVLEDELEIDENDIKELRELVLETFDIEILKFLECFEMND